MTLPHASLKELDIAGVIQVNENVAFELVAGGYSFSYMPTKEYVSNFNRHTDLKTLINTSATKRIIWKCLPKLANTPPYMLPVYESKSIEELKSIGKLEITEKMIIE